MSWPTLIESKRVIDWSWFQNSGWPFYKPFDVEAFLLEHLEVEAAILRFCWPDGSPDKHYPYYYDEFTRLRVPVMGYGWPNSNYPVTRTMDHWKAAMGDRVPKVVFSDWEETDALQGTKGQLTDLMRNHDAGVSLAFPGIIHGNYSRAHWLDQHIIPSDWLRQQLWWLAHWIYPPPEFNRQAKSFSELDGLLPIDNNFTPFRGNLVQIPADKVVGWQASSKFAIVPRGTSDGGYFKRSFLDPIFGQEPPPPPPPDEGPIPIELLFPAGKAEVTITELEV